MTELKDLEGFIWGFAMLAPGFLFMFGRSRFLTGRMPSVSSSVFEYLMVSSVYFAAVYPVFIFLDLSSYFSALLFLFVLPLVAGSTFGFCTQKEFFRSIGSKLGINPIHSSPTAWDYAFSDRQGYYWVVVNLNSGGKYFGVFGPASLASSDLNNRDIYLEDVRKQDFSAIEENGRKRSVWIDENDIRSIEIIKD